jgi:catechol 2,3-dioxygenase
VSSPAQTFPEAPPAARLADATKLGAVSLTVTDLDAAIDFYSNIIGLELKQTDSTGAAARSATLGTASEDLVILRENPAASAAGRHAGLYHFALLFPSRAELARVAIRVAAAHTPIDGASDHGTHEAIYLPDPSGNGIELAADRPREQWPKPSESEFMTGGPRPLDLRALLLCVEGEEPTPRAADGVHIGHLHLHVGDLDAARSFYRDGLGFAVQFELPSAVFASYGGYHHHVAFNIWRGRGAPPAPPEAVGLRHWSLILAGDEERDALRERLTALGVAVEAREDGLLARDPSGTAVLITAALP